MIRQLPAAALTVPGAVRLGLWFLNWLLIALLLWGAQFAHGEGAPENVLFAIELDNSWSYQANGYTWRHKVTSVEGNVYTVEGFEDGTPDVYDRQRVQAVPGELLEWGWGVGDYFLEYDQPLIAAWYPMAQGDSRTSAAWADEYTRVEMTVDVLAEDEIVVLAFDSFKANKIRYRYAIHSTDPDNPLDITSTYDYWVVPYLGRIKHQYGTDIELLSSFAILGGTVTQDTDTDRDCLKDYQELIFYETDRQSSDTDADGFSDALEVRTQSNPLDKSSVPSCPGDLDKDGDADGDDLALFAGSYGKRQCMCPCTGDVNGDADIDGVDLLHLARSIASGQCL